jgi:hypothetical protein
MHRPFPRASKQRPKDRPGGQIVGVASSTTSADRLAGLSDGADIRWRILAFANSGEWEAFIDSLDSVRRAQAQAADVCEPRNAVQTRTGYRELPDEGDRGEGRDQGNGRDDAGRAAAAAGSDQRRRRSGSRVGIHRDRDATRTRGRRPTSSAPDARPTVGPRSTSARRSSSTSTTTT